MTTTTLASHSFHTKTTLYDSAAKRKTRKRYDNNDMIPYVDKKMLFCLCPKCRNAKMGTGG
jgi:hypothetical protein